MKRIWQVGLALVLILGVFGGAVALAQSTCTPVAHLVARPGVNKNIRAGAGEQFAIVGTLRPGSPPLPAAELEASGWWRLCDGRYIGSSVVNTTTPPPLATATRTPGPSPTPSPTPTRITEAPSGGMWIKASGIRHWMDFERDCGRQGERIICVVVFDVVLQATALPMTPTPLP